VIVSHIHGHSMSVSLGRHARAIPFALAAAALLGAGAVGGCIPHHQAYRGAFGGRVFDPNGRPVSGATVVVCTADRASSFAGCPHRAEAWTDPDGRFQFPGVAETDWAETHPTTHLTVCARDGTGRVLVAPSTTVDASGATEPQVSLSVPERPSAQNACVAPE
jgi:hypothetical protein